MTEPEAGPVVLEFGGPNFYRANALLKQPNAVCREAKISILADPDAIGRIFGRDICTILKSGLHVPKPLSFIGKAADGCIPADL